MFIIKKLLFVFFLFMLLVFLLILSMSSILLITGNEANLFAQGAIPIPEYSIVGRTYVNYLHHFRLRLSTDYWQFYTGMLAPRMNEGAIVVFENKDIFMTGFVKIVSATGTDSDFLYNTFTEFSQHSDSLRIMEEESVIVVKSDPVQYGYRMSANFMTDDGLAYVIGVAVIFQDKRYYIQISGIYDLYREYYNHLDEILRSFNFFMSTQQASPFVNNNSYHSYHYDYTISVPNDGWDIYNEIDCQIIGMESILTLAEIDNGIYGTLDINRQMDVSLEEYGNITLEYLRVQSNGSFIVLESGMLDQTNTDIYKIAGIAYDTYFIYGLAQRGSEKYQFVFYTRNYLDSDKLNEVNDILRSFTLDRRSEREILALDARNRTIYSDNRVLINTNKDISVELPESSWIFTDERLPSMMDSNAFIIFKNSYDSSFGYITFEHLTLDMNEYIQLLDDLAHQAGGDYLALLDEGRIIIDDYIGFFITYSARLFGLNYIFHIVVIERGPLKYKIVFWVLANNYDLVVDDWDYIINHIDFDIVGDKR